jgi:NAD(P)-dependent dehydrogenase (short-subunit alcohol dehydrogenase family)
VSRASTGESGGRVALVTGAYRGIGLEVSRQLARRGFVVILTARDPGKAGAAAAGLKEEGLKVVPAALDVTDARSVEEAARFVADRFGRLDVLVNNAAVLYDTWQTAAGANLDTVREAFETNTLGPWRVSQALLRLLRESGHGRIVNVSSESGSLSSMGGAAAPRTPAEGAAGVVWAATLPDDGPTGGFFRDGEPLAW